MKLLGSYWEKKPQNYKMVDSGEAKKYYNHIPAEEVKNQIGNYVWNSYYKFCFEINPFEQVISMYFYITKSRYMENFDNWLKKKYFKNARI